MQLPLTVESYQFTEIIQEGIAHSSDGISQRLPTCLCACIRVVGACVCVFLRMSVRERMSV